MDFSDFEKSLKSMEIPDQPLAVFHEINDFTHFSISKSRNLLNNLITKVSNMIFTVLEFQKFAFQMLLIQL